MALLTKVGSFAIPTTTGNHAVTGVGFQPKAVIFFGNKQTIATVGADAYTAATGANPDQPCYFGMATSSSQRGVISVGDDFTGGGAVEAQKAIQLVDTFDVETDGADLVSFDADGFTLNWSTVGGSAQPATQLIVNYIALGGSDLTNAKVHQFTAPTATGSQAVTGVGFHPDAVIFFGQDDNITELQAVGFACSSTNRAAQASSFDSSTGIGSHLRTDKAIVQIAGTTLKRECDLTSLDSDGFTLNWTTVASPAPNIFALCLRGGQFRVFSDTQKAGTGNKATTGVGFQPNAILLTSVRMPASSTPHGSAGEGNAKMMGAASSTTARGVQFFGSANAGCSILDRTKVVAMLDDTTTGTIVARADLASLDADGFTLNYDTTDSSNCQIIGMAFGNAAAGGGSSVSLVGTSAGAGAASTALRRLARITSTVAAIGALTASLHLNVRIAATSAGTAGTPTKVRVAHKLAAQVPGASGLTAVPRVLRKIASQVSGTSTVSAPVRLLQKIASSVPGSSDTSTTLSLQGAVPLQAQVDASSGTSVGIRVGLSVAASPAGLSSATATASRQAGIASSVAGASTAAATPRRLAGISTASAATSAHTARLIVTHPLQAQAAAASGETAGVRLQASLRTAEPAMGTMAGAVKVDHRLAAAISGTSVATSGSAVAKRLSSACDASAAASGALSTTHAPGAVSFFATVPAQSSTTGDLTGTWHLRTNQQGMPIGGCAAQSIVSGKLGNAQALVGTIAATSTALTFVIDKHLAGTVSRAGTHRDFSGSARVLNGPTGLVKQIL